MVGLNLLMRTGGGRREKRRVYQKSFLGRLRRSGIKRPTEMSKAYNLQGHYGDAALFEKVSLKKIED